jgi:hypothetical protein
MFLFVVWLVGNLCNYLYIITFIIIYVNFLTKEAVWNERIESFLNLESIVQVVAYSGGESTVSRPTTTPSVVTGTCTYSPKKFLPNKKG